MSEQLQAIVVDDDDLARLLVDLNDKLAAHQRTTAAIEDDLNRLIHYVRGRYQVPPGWLLGNVGDRLGFGPPGGNGA